MLKKICDECNETIDISRPHFQMTIKGTALQIGMEMKNAFVFAETDLCKNCLKKHVNENTSNYIEKYFKDFKEIYGKDIKN